MQAECITRGIETPACYIDGTGETRLGLALPGYYTVLIDQRGIEIFTDRELRALMAHELKHLYQGVADAPAESIEAEYDCDRAAVTSTDYDTVSTYVDKTIHLMIDETFKAPQFKKLIQKVHATFKGVIAKNCFVQLDERHPSPADRLRAMYQVSQQNLEKHRESGR